MMEFTEKKTDNSISVVLKMTIGGHLVPWFSIGRFSAIKTIRIKYLPRVGEQIDEYGNEESPVVNLRVINVIYDSFFIDKVTIEVVPIHWNIDSQTLYFTKYKKDYYTQLFEHADLCEKWGWSIIKENDELFRSLELAREYIKSGMPPYKAAKKANPGDNRRL